MKKLLSIRMRACRTVRGGRFAPGNTNEIHISGAEGLFEASEIDRVVKKYIARATDHPKGNADKIVITIENINKKPAIISSLPVATVVCNNCEESKKAAREILQSLNMSKASVDAAFGVIKKGGMRGSALVSVRKSIRLEPDKEKGVRVSRLGIDKSSLRALSTKLSRHGINTDTVKEALILASKVISCRHIVAELCISDDPDYTTGYVASREYGYVRIPNIKRKRSKSGGRVFLVKEGTNIKELIHYLERVPVIIGETGSCRGIMTVDEILRCTHQ